MKKPMVLALVLWLGVGLAWGQSRVPTPDGKNPSNPNMREVEHRIHEKMMRIKDAMKSGSITEDQAKVERAKLKAVRTQEKTFLTQNGKMELTADQKQQLDQAVDQVTAN